MAESRVQRKLAAILCADVQGYSRLMGRDEEGTLRSLTASREIFAQRVSAHGGRIVSTPGDALLVDFPSVVDAVRAAMEIQGALAEKNAPLSPEKRMAFRIGVNLGDVMMEGEDILGDGVNIAARLESLAEGGGICISGIVRDSVKSKLELTLEDLGEQRVKNIAEPVRAYRVLLNGGPDASASAAGDPGAVPPALPDKPSVAVLAFDNMSGDPEQAYFSDGLAEDIITDLSRISGMLVVARNSSFAYKGRTVDLGRVGRELGVRHVMEGSVRKSGDRVRITAQLIECRTGNHLWGERYDRKLEDVFAVQDEITAEIVTALDVTLARGEQARIWRQSLKNPQARDRFYRARELSHRGTKAEMAQAREFFREVALLEPDSPIGPVGEALTHWWDAFRGWSDSRPDSIGQGLARARKAVSLAPSNGEAHAILGLVLLLQGQYDESLAETGIAVEMAPNGADVRFYAAIVNMLSCRPEQGRNLIKRAERLCPVVPGMYMNILGVCCRELELFDEGIAALRRGVALDPGLATVRFALISILCAAGRHEEARTEWEALRNVAPGFSLEGYSKALPFREPEVSERVLENLRKAELI